MTGAASMVLPAIAALAPQRRYGRFRSRIAARSVPRRSPSFVSPVGTGPTSTAPVLALNCEPRHGQTITFAEGS
jgi:hypothetical protein